MRNVLLTDTFTGAYDASEDCRSKMVGNSLAGGRNNNLDGWR
jgi:hypothetical protein